VCVCVCRAKQLLERRIHNRTARLRGSGGGLRARRDEIPRLAVFRRRPTSRRGLEELVPLPIWRADGVCVCVCVPRETASRATDPQRLGLEVLLESLVVKVTLLLDARGVLQLEVALPARAACAACPVPTLSLWVVPRG
jgi:hypothetical protein